MIIDMHAHIGDLRTPLNLDRRTVTVETLIARLDKEGIDKAVVLPWPACPEAVELPGLLSPLPDILSQIRAAAAHPDRLILFGNADPRWAGNSLNADFSWLFDRFVEMGCVGMGEVSANILFDDQRTVNLFRQCGKYQFPVTIESVGPGEGHYGFIDEVGSPHLERLLQLVPETTIIGHGPGFWAEIASDLSNDDKSSYPKGPIDREGSVCRLLRSYPNLYADLSALSGYNAITRDPPFGIRFLIEFQDKLCFGTDACFGDAKSHIPHVEYLRRLHADGQIGSEVFDKIAYRNALRILKRCKS